MVKYKWRCNLRYQVWKDRPAPTEGQTVFYTSKDDALYVICTKLSEKPIIVSGLKGAGKVSLLGTTLKVNAGFSSGKLTIVPPVLNPSNNPCDFAWVFKVEL